MSLGRALAAGGKEAGVPEAPSVGHARECARGLFNLIPLTKVTAGETEVHEMWRVRG